MKNTKQLTETAIAVALAAVLAFIPLYRMPQGGDVSLTMIPLLLIAFRRGPVSGIAAGAVYGLISMAINGVIYHPMSILLDYVLAFGVLGIAGFFKTKPYRNYLRNNCRSRRKIFKLVFKRSGSFCKLCAGGSKPMDILAYISGYIPYTGAYHMPRCTCFAFCKSA